MATSDARTIATHDGTFHCDEVLACHMLRNRTASYANANILRTRDPEKLETASIVVDVGAVYDPSVSRFDHHQRTFDTRFQSEGKRSRTKLSSAGLIYKHFGLEIVKSVARDADLQLTEEQLNRVYLKVYDSFMEAIDAVDNGISQYESAKAARYESSTDLSARVARLNAEWYEENPDQDANFQKAISMAGEELDDCILHVIKSWLPARTIIAKAMSQRFQFDESGAIVVLNEWAPWKDHLFSLEDEEGASEQGKLVKYVVYQDMTGSSWRVQCVPVAKQSFQSRQSLPEQWRGIRDEDLSRLTGISNCIFVHSSGFIGGNKDYEGAMEMTRKALEMHDISEH